MSVNSRELRPVRLGLQSFADQICHWVLGMFCNSKGMRSTLLNQKVQFILPWAEWNNVTMVPQFVVGKRNLIMDIQSHSSQAIGLEWSLNDQVFRDLQKRWPVMVNFFTFPLNKKLSNYFSPVVNPMSLGTIAVALGSLFPCLLC